MEQTRKDQLVGALIGLARATEGNDHLLTDTTAQVTLECLRALATDADGADLLQRIDREKRKLIPNCYICLSPCGRNNCYDMENLSKLPEDVRQLKTRILEAACAAAARETAVGAIKTLYLALYAIGMDDWGAEELLPVIRQVDALL